MIRETTYSERYKRDQGERELRAPPIWLLYSISLSAAKRLLCLISGREVAVSQWKRQRRVGTADTMDNIIIR